MTIFHVLPVEITWSQCLSTATEKCIASIVRGKLKESNVNNTALIIVAGLNIMSHYI